MFKKKYSFRIYCNFCKAKLIDSNEVSKTIREIVKHKCDYIQFEIGISKFKNSKHIYNELIKVIKC
ncbi:hypothetical protein LCGC14_0797900 [marine sediment metagenome]|uniref:Uncharacterized protein n=1 Tax=marine sediment metagenome TaxID=412755 RepID=A0A0F9PV07_9ZZZZ